MVLCSSDAVQTERGGTNDAGPLRFGAAELKLSPVGGDADANDDFRGRRTQTANP